MRLLNEGIEALFWVMAIISRYFYNPNIKHDYSKDIKIEIICYKLVNIINYLSMHIVIDVDKRNN